MAGMLPGVELARRRRASHDKHKLSSDSPVPRSHPRNQQLSNMDETALRARRNLEQKLKSFSPSSNRGKMMEDRSRKELEKEVGGVCVEMFQARLGVVVNLPCLPGCHAESVIPWVTTHYHSRRCFW